MFPQHPMPGLWKILFLVGVLLLLSLAVISLTPVPKIIFGGAENASPGDWVKEDQIKVYSDQVVLNISGATWASFTNTNSMDPFLDENSNAIEIIPKNPDAIRVGDVVAYKTSSGVVIHRVVEKGKDTKGIFYLLKGDNNRLGDPVKVRFEDIRGVVVAVVY